VASLDDIRDLMPLVSLGLEGVIVGRALYNGTVRLPEALAWWQIRRSKLHAGVLGLGTLTVLSRSFSGTLSTRVLLDIWFKIAAPCQQDTSYWPPSSSY